MTNRTDAYNFGVVSYKRGLTIEVNPFKDDTVESKDFVKGWKAANKEVSAAAGSGYRSAKRSSPNFNK